MADKIFHGIAFVAFVVISAFVLRWILNTEPAVIEAIVGIVGAVLLTALYSLPAIIAYRKLQPNRVSILLVNLIFGWTVIGWFVALLWATAKPTQMVLVKR
jgi:Superinfection immunity protein